MAVDKSNSNYRHRCPLCGRRGRYKRFPTVTGRKRHRMVELIADNPGILSRDVIAALYKSDPNGGPNSLNIVSVAVVAANRQLAPAGYRITGSPGRGGGYRLNKINPV
jgi:hypothetical protein